MNEKISVIICNDYKLELASILSQEGFEKFTAFYSSVQQNGPDNCGHTEKIINSIQQENQTTHIIGGSCLSITQKEYGEYDGIYVHKISHCHYYLASKSIVDALQNQGAYLVSPGWLNSWQKKIEHWGFDQQTAQEFFRETTSKIVLLDTGICDNSEEQLKAFAEFLDLPHETLYVGLDHLKMYLKMVMYNFKEKHTNDQIEFIQHKNETANYAMALEMVRQLSESKSASETVQQTIDIFSMLFSPERIIFHSMTEPASIQQKTFQFEDVTCLTDNGQGFLVKIDVDGETYGVFEIINVVHPQYLNAYRNLTLNLIGVVSLALEEASYKEQLLWATKKISEAEMTRDMALGAAKVGVFDWDIENDSLIWDETLCNLYGLSKQDFSGAYEAWSNGLHPDDKEKAEKDIQLALRGEKEFNSEFRVVWQDGSIHYINGRATVLRNEAGDPVRMLGVNWDITDIKNLEEELRHYSFMLMSVQDSIIEVDLEGRITHWNKGSEIMFGFSKDEALGKTTSIIHKPEETENLRATIRETIKKEGVWIGEINFVRKDLKTGYCSTTTVPMLDDRGNMIGLLGINRDITARKKSEGKLKALSIDLERKKKQLELLAATDSLTGLINRRFFIGQIKSEIARQRRSGKSFSIVISDIDNFKNINDSYGHPFGDSILVKVSNTLKNNIREQDFIGRWGGEEFILLLPETDLEGAFILSETLRKKLEASDYRLEDRRITITATFGISECKPEDDYLESIKKADQALYKGKEAGRNCVMREGK